MDNKDLLRLIAFFIIWLELINASKEDNNFWNEKKFNEMEEKFRLLEGSILYLPMVCLLTYTEYELQLFGIGMEINKKIGSLNHQSKLYMFFQIPIKIRDILKNHTVKQKRVVIKRLLNIVLLADYILECLIVKKSPYENILAHYTNIAVCNLLLGKINNNQDEVENNSKLRLGSIENVNDPLECILYEKLFGIETINQLEEFEQRQKFLGNGNSIFLSCFSFNIDSLNQFRLYGKKNELEASGVSIVLDVGFFSKNISIIDYFETFDEEILNADEIKTEVKEELEKLPLYRCIYLDDVGNLISIAHKDKLSFFREFLDYYSAENLKKEWDNYLRGIKQKEKDLEKIIEELKKQKNKIEEHVKDVDDARQVVHQIIKNLLLVRVRFLFKHAAYKEEQECRICDIDSNKGKTIFDIRDNAIKNTYVEYDPDIRDFIKEIKFGNNVHEQEKN